MRNTTNTAFLDDVLGPSYATPMVVMFHASWCGPCKSMKPLVERLAAELPFVLVGVDGGAERELAASEGVRGVPALLVYKDGKQVGASLAGAKTEAQIRSYLAAAGVPGQVIMTRRDDNLPLGVKPAPSPSPIFTDAGKSEKVIGWPRAPYGLPTRVAR